MRKRRISGGQTVRGRVSDALKRRVEKLCASKEMKESELVRQAVLEYLDRCEQPPQQTEQADQREKRPRSETPEGPNSGRLG